MKNQHIDDFELRDMGRESYPRFWITDEIEMDLEKQEA